MNLVLTIVCFKADHSPPFVPRLKNAWIYTSTPQIRLHGMVLS